LRKSVKPLTLRDWPCSVLQPAAEAREGGK